MYELGGQNPHQGHIFPFALQIAPLLFPFLDQLGHPGGIKAAGGSNSGLGQQLADIVRGLGP